MKKEDKNDRTESNNYISRPNAVGAFGIVSILEKFSKWINLIENARQ